MSAGVTPEVLLVMPARPEGVGVVRQALAGVADARAAPGLRPAPPPIFLKVAPDLEDVYFQRLRQHAKAA